MGKMKTAAEKKTVTVRARCEPTLAKFVADMASLRHIDDADVIREALWSYKERQEQRMQEALGHAR